jgi:hypothetical protein
MFCIESLKGGNERALVGGVKKKKYYAIANRFIKKMQ